MKLNKGGVIIAFLAMVVASEAAARELSTSEKEVITQAAKQQLKDPDSAKFYWQDYKGGEIYCAHVNAKNSYGGFAGKALLLVGVKTNSKGKVISAEVSIRSDNMMDEICTERGYSV
ncbi:hypothetical protein [Leclercia adecarboxylata]|uniref:hypothetical protein n=1 Tax=Leclercia adecarboxylata TaxID=83655 RepID=UPI001F056538|nr:hypothetical protein [Leclercia adecarboxylata]MCH2683569.1 hypothetical protein [Leclercia adecarboxylata]